jgi:formylglycine-generating enzyme required for sulfatase activity
VINSIGIELIQIDAGSFKMGALNATPEYLGGPPVLTGGDYDEKPVHKVIISRGFYMSVGEVTAEQYRKFRPNYKGKGRLATGISWYDAGAFCEWLSEKEGKPYRLPTEAEWEYACRAGTATLFHDGDLQPDSGTLNAWELQGMHTNGCEWCLDWHGLYSYEDQVDPVGPERGIARVVRGGPIFEVGHQSVGPDAPYYARSANRGGIAPSYAPVHDHGTATFRVVQAPMPTTKPTPYEAPFIQQCLEKDEGLAKKGPNPEVPYYQLRPILPIPPENTQVAAAIEAAGLPPGALAHNHSPAFVACPNGDLLAVYYSSCTSSTESWPNIGFVGVRLRFGAEQWDMPELFIDFPDLNEYHMLLWNDNGTLHMFTGAIGFDRVPFEWCHSTDNGATWTEFEFPPFVGELGPFDSKPIAHAFRDADNTMYMASDGVGNISLLFASDDNGKTWYDTGGRTHGRHTVFATVKDGSILGMGGKKSNIDGYMPKSISFDKGKTWQKSKTPFAALSSNQRPSMARLASGRLFFASDFQTSFKGLQPKGMKQRGALVALSDDDGKTWHIKRLNAATPHEGAVVPRPPYRSRPDWHIHPHKDGSVGYSVATQSANGVIHLITSMNHPNLHFAMNEAWILSDDDADGGADGRYLLDGPQSWHYDNGQKQWQVTCRAGRKVGTETYWRRNGKKKWAWQHNEDGSSTWTQWWPNGNKKAESAWKDHRCQGTATRWDPNGKVVRQMKFVDGRTADETQ